MESKWLFGFDETGDFEGPASAMCVPMVESLEESGVWWARKLSAEHEIE